MNYTLVEIDSVWDTWLKYFKHTPPSSPKKNIELSRFFSLFYKKFQIYKIGFFLASTFCVTVMFLYNNLNSFSSAQPENFKAVWSIDATGQGWIFQQTTNMNMNDIQMQK